MAAPAAPPIDLSAGFVNESAPPAPLPTKTGGLDLSAGFVPEGNEGDRGTGPASGQSDIGAAVGTNPLHTDTNPIPAPTNAPHMVNGRDTSGGWTDSNTWNQKFDTSGVEEFGSETLNAIKGAVQGMNPVPQNDGEKEAMKIAGIGGLLAHRLYEGLKGGDHPMLASELPGVIHDLNNSKDPVGTYAKILQKTATQAGGQAVTAIATEGALKGVGKVASKGSDLAAKGSEYFEERTPRVQAAKILQDKYAAGQAEYNAGVKGSTAASQTVSNVAQDAAKSVIDPTDSGTFAHTPEGESYTFGDAAADIEDHVKPAFEALDKESGGQFQILRNQEQAALKVMRNPSTVAAAADARESLDATRASMDDMFSKSTIDPEHLQAARDGWRKSSTLQELHDNLDQAWSEPQAARDVTGNPESVNPKTFASRLNKAVRDIDADRLNETIGPDGVKKLYGINDQFARIAGQADFVKTIQQVVKQTTATGKAIQIGGTVIPIELGAQLLQSFGLHGLAMGVGVAGFPIAAIRLMYTYPEAASAILRVTSKALGKVSAVTGGGAGTLNVRNAVADAVNESATKAGIDPAGRTWKDMAQDESGELTIGRPRSATSIMNGESNDAVVGASTAPQSNLDRLRQPGGALSPVYRDRSKITPQVPDTGRSVTSIINGGSNDLAEAKAAAEANLDKLRQPGGPLAPSGHEGALEKLGLKPAAEGQGGVRTLKTPEQLGLKPKTRVLGHEGGDTEVPIEGRHSSAKQSEDIDELSRQMIANIEKHGAASVIKHLKKQ